MPKLITVYWRAIPAQVIAKHGRNSAKVPLSQRFHDAIDRAAMRAGKGSSDAYLADWKRVNAECGDDLQREAEAAAARLEGEYDSARLLALIRSKGIAPAAGA
ncbi:MAG: virulence factor [Gammaproteobacteria bacterium]